MFIAYLIVTVVTAAANAFSATLDFSRPQVLRFAFSLAERSQPPLR